MLRSLFGASRFVIALAVAGAFLGSVILLIVATLTLVRIAWDEAAGFYSQRLTRLTGQHVDHLAVELIEITDIILLGTVLYIVSLGLYQLFIDRSLQLPPWLKINDLTDLKRDLIGVVVVLLGVSFLGEVVDWEGDPNIFPLGIGIAAVIIALGVIQWITPNDHVADDAHDEKP